MSTSTRLCVVLWAVMVPCLALSISCGGRPKTDYSGLELAPVSGTVTLDGKPLANARIFFETPDERYSYGLSDENGHYVMMFNSEQEGVKPGDVTVRIWTARGGLEFGEELDPDEPGMKKEMVPAKYNKNSDLTRTIEPGKSQTFDFALDP